MRKPVKILLVDDNAKIRQFTRSLFDGLAAEFVECANGHEALVSYREHRPDWVLMDIHMPELDGLSATRQITRAFPEARVIIVTQFEGPDLRAAAREAGACDYVLKDDLLQVRALIEAQAHPEPPSPR